MYCNTEECKEQMNPPTSSCGEGGWSEYTGVMQGAKPLFRMETTPHVRIGDF